MRHYNGSESCGFVFTPVNITLFRLPRRGLPRPAGLPRPGLPRPAGLPRPCSYFTPRLPHRQATTPPSYIIPQATTPAGLPRPSLYPVDTGYHTCLVLSFNFIKGPRPAQEAQVTQHSPKHTDGERQERERSKSAVPHPGCDVYSTSARDRSWVHTLSETVASLLHSNPKSSLRGLLRAGQDKSFRIILYLYR